MRGRRPTGLSDLLGAYMAESTEKKDNVSRAIAVSSLLVSVLTFFYGSLDERYFGALSVGEKRAYVTEIEGKPPTISVSDLVITFINTGNRPIAIEHIAYSIFATAGKPDNQCSDHDDPIVKQPKPYMVWASRSVKANEPTGFTPFAVKPGETEVRTYSFTGDLWQDALRPRDEHLKAKFYVGCIFATVNTQATGRKELLITAAVSDLSDINWLGILLPKAQQVDLVNARWPFYLVTNFFASFRSKSDWPSP